MMRPFIVLAVIATVAATPQPTPTPVAYPQTEQQNHVTGGAANAMRHPEFTINPNGSISVKH